MNKLAEKIWLGLLVLVLGLPFVARAEPVPLDRLGRVNGIAIDPSNPERLLLATRQGLFVGASDGFATPISNLNAGLTALASDPQNPQKLFASGASETAGNLGVMASEDGGLTWRKISDGDGGPVAFQAMAVSPANPNLLYGVNKDLQVSLDGGVSWRRVAVAPKRLFAVAASSKDENTLFAATMKGLRVSRDGGRKWQAGFLIQRPATMVHTTPTGRQLAFVYGTGLIETQEPDLAWKTVAGDFQDRVIIGLAIAPDDPQRLYGFADTGAIMTSGDAGKTWRGFEGSQQVSAERLGKGKQLYVDNCQACHGVGGIGERPGEPNAKDEFGFVAPAMNDDAHAWHHPDRQLVETILNGSERNKRMIAWKETFSRADAENIVIYIKSLWSFRSLACQGARHMACMR